MIRNSVFLGLFPKYCGKPISRQLHNSLKLWENDLTTDIKLQIEKHWKTSVMSKRFIEKNKPNFYVLPMFPYPSGNLHMGHVRVYSISDSVARFQELNGYNVIHPIGWDAFGLPAENAAIERNTSPDAWTLKNIDSMKSQLLQLAYKYDWDREINTCHPEYYKWTQFIFLKLYENGLAYQDKALVNWDPVDKTVLADEQVDEFGCSWRSGAKVEKKILTQWFIKTTKFAKKLYDGLDSPILDNWKDIINLQKHWIGECNGVVVSFKVKSPNKSKCIDIWTSQPLKFLHGQFVTIKSDSVLAKEFSSDIKKPYEKAFEVLNPITGKEMAVYIVDDAQYAEGREIRIACPAVDDHDRQIATLVNELVPNYAHMNLEVENEKALKAAKQKNVETYAVNSNLKDWLISRQRYWGTPIPIIHCKQCGAVPVPSEELPIVLPKVDYIRNGTEALKQLHDWINCPCPKCGTNATRETDTMDTFVDSSWYYYRFLDPKNSKMPFDKKQLDGNIPVTLYIGGKEHAVLHLYYARFMSHFFHSMGWTPSSEPFKKLIVQGMVMGQSYKIKSTGKYLPPENVEKVGKVYKEKGSNEPVVVQWEKMSKSKYNGVNPENLLSLYGCDTTRLFILADVPPSTSRNWSEATFPGVLNWQKRLWLTMREFLNHRNNENLLAEEINESFHEKNEKLWQSRNYFIATATYHFKYTHKLSVGISRLQSLTSSLRSQLPPLVIAKSPEFELSLAALIIMMAPLAPHFCSELWAGFLSANNMINKQTEFIQWDKDVFQQRWPVVDANYDLSFQCKVDGADRSELKIKPEDLRNLTHDEALKLMLKEQNIVKRVQKGIEKSNFELYPDCRAILHIYTKRKPQEKISASNT